MTLKQLFFVGAIVVFAGIVFSLAANPVMSQMPIPKDFSFEETKPMSPVTFSHDWHVTQKKLKCPACHTKIFKMKKLVASPEMTMDKLNAGEFCGTCHNGTKAFTTNDAKACLKCHVKK
ncbi:MAG: c(7)-type cytochrome triheme domain-containing protein [Candidatus Binatia bacterium]